MNKDNVSTNNQDALTLESIVISKFEGVSNPKKIKKLATKLYCDLNTELQKKMCLDIINSKDPVATVNKYTNIINDVSVITESFIDAGYHGMILINNNVYPVEVKTLKNWLQSKDVWTEDDEVNIHYEAAGNWMKTYNTSNFLGKVVLYREFGFSGIPRLIEIHATD